MKVHMDINCGYWHCLWTFGGRLKFLGEWASLKNRMVVMWACSAPPFCPRSIECIKYTLPVLAATPLQRTSE